MLSDFVYYCIIIVSTSHVDNPGVNSKWYVTISCSRVIFAIIGLKYRL